MDSQSLSFGEWLAGQLSERGWSQSDLMRAAGLKAGVVSHWVNDRRTPDPESCRKIADALQIDPDIVLDKAGHRPADDRDLIAELPEEVRWYFLNYKRLPAERQKLLLRQLRSYYEDLGLPDPTKGLLEDE